MQRSDLDRIENLLGVSLPVAYREAMLAYPFAPDHQAAELWMPNDAAIILDMNRPIPERRSAAEPWLRPDRRSFRFLPDRQIVQSSARLSRVRRHPPLVPRSLSKAGYQET